MRQWSAILCLLCMGGVSLFGPYSLAAPPAEISSNLTLKKTAVTLFYNPEHKQSDWAYYSLDQRSLADCVKRTNNFKPDPALRTDQSAQLKDYKGSGFDRGHLSPAADNRWSKQAMEESFHLSNISPQPPRFNQGPWARLEHLVRAWAQEKGGLWVTTGPVLHRGLRTIGESRVSTPEHYYKVLVSQRAKARLAVAFLFPTESSETDFSAHALSIDELEEITGIDFNYGLENEKALESRLSLAGWNFRAEFQAPPCRSPQYSLQPGAALFSIFHD